MDQLTQEELRELREVIDRKIIYDNIMKYCRGLDRFDLDLLKGSYWPDATGNHGGVTASAYKFCEAAVKGKHRFRNMNHHVSNTAYEFIGNTQAKVETYFQIQCTWILEEGDRDYTHGGRYKELYEKRGSEWRVLHRVVVYDWCRDIPSTTNFERSGFTPNQANSGAIAPHDPIYQPWGPEAVSS